MKRSILFWGMALAACLSGCTDDRFVDEDTIKTPVQSGDEILFGSTLSGDAGKSTRTEYGDRTNTGVPVYWKEDGTDTIAIFCLQASAPANHLVSYKVLPETEDLNGDKLPDKHQASSVTKVDPAAAGLQWGDRNVKHRFYAFYPSRAVKGTEEENQTGKITANIPVTQQVQEWRLGKFTSSDGNFNGKDVYFGLPDMDLAYMYAYKEVDPTQVDASKPIDLQFKNLVTVLDITIQGPDSDTPATITNINVDAIEGTQPILTGDFTCNIRAAKDSTEVTATCDPVGSFNEERGRISIPCYDKKTGQFIQLRRDELLNVKAYIIPQDTNTVTKRTLRVTVSLLNGAPCRKTLSTDDVMPHKINRIILPKLEVGGTNYWMSSLDPNIYVSELSIPGSKFSVLTAANQAQNIYQNATIEQQFKDGVRAFIFQTATKGRNSNPVWPYLYNNFTYESFKVVSENKNRPVMDLSNALSEIASYLDECEREGKKNEFAFVMLTYTTGDYDLGSSGIGGSRNEADPEQFWISKLREEVNKIAGVTSNRIYTDEITPDTRIADVAGKIILKANYNSENMISNYGSTTAPIMFTYWGGYYGPQTNGVFYQDQYNGMPMDWGVPKWYLDSNADLRWYYQEVTSVGGGSAEATRDQKVGYIRTLFTESVNLYKNDNAHRTWFMNDLGGYYADNVDEGETGITDLAKDMNALGVQELQNREENAGLGLVFMNFADKQEKSGASYKSDWLIQTLIDNNFKFALRKKSSTPTPAPDYNAAYRNGGNAIGWDE